MTTENADMYAPLSGDELAAVPAAAAEGSRGEETWLPMGVVPGDAPPPPERHPTLGKPVRIWPYRDAEGELLGYVCRFNLPGTDSSGKRRKAILPLRYGSLDGRLGWHWKGWSDDDSRPLYGLDRPARRPDAWVIYAEGEKAADAAEVLFPDCVGVSPMNGAGAVDRNDHAPLAGRRVFIARDQDKPGRAFGDAAAELLRALGCRVGELRWPAHLIVRDGEVVPRDGPVPAGHDLADTLDEGWTTEIVDAKRAAKAGLFFAEPYQTKEDIDDALAALGALGINVVGADAEAALGGPAKRRTASDWSFRLSAHGVEKEVETKEGGPEWRWFCSPLEIVAFTRDAENENWGRLLVVTDNDGRRHEWAMPMDMLAGSGGGVPAPPHVPRAAAGTRQVRPRRPA